ncbi:hypothetical protein H17ap60334_11368 [Thermosipho africanus H17ap60334]|jgi:hypothetical protein|nr:hypothetical protein H17ap60334_11368 [Thermosipho africanus H17ap60334]
MGIDNILIYHPESYHGEGKKIFLKVGILKTQAQMAHMSLLLYLEYQLEVIPILLSR